ncbi:MAG: hypothetical protein WBN39_01160 [Flavobacteriaceae bacterium]
MRVLLALPFLLASLRGNRQHGNFWYFAALSSTNFLTQKVYCKLRQFYLYTFWRQAHFARPVLGVGVVGASHQTGLTALVANLIAEIKEG